MSGFSLDGFRAFEAVLSRTVPFYGSASRGCMAKTVRYIALFCLALSAFTFMGADMASGHSDSDPQNNEITSYDVSKDRKKLPEFLKHAGRHFFVAENFNDSLSLLNDFREPGGDWFHDDKSYLILLTERGGVYLHAKQRELEDQDWSQLIVGCDGEKWSDLINKLSNSETRSSCVKYKGQQEKNPTDYAHAQLISGQFVPFTHPDMEKQDDFILIGGLDHAPQPETASTFDELLNSIIRSSESLGGVELSDAQKEQFKKLATPEIHASDVDNEHDLIRFLNSATNLITTSIDLPEYSDPVILRRIFRFEGGPWRSGSTYIYIMDEKGNVIFNGANRNIEHTNLLNFKDGDDPFIQRILKAARGETGFSKCVDVEGREYIERENFVCYNWDDPGVEGDEPIGGGAGGTSSKLAYTIQYKETDQRIYVFGTGLYLEIEQAKDDSSDSDDGGCSIARTDAMAGSFVTNSFSVLALLFLTIFLRNRFRAL